MKMRALILLAGLAGLAALPASAFAQKAPTSSSPGTCVKLVLAGADQTQGCAGKLTGMVLPDGTSFLIFSSKSTMVGFSGKLKEMRKSGRATTLPVSFVNIGVPGKEPNAIPARGSCTSDRAAGTTVCAATTEQGEFSGAFKNR